MGDLTFPNPNRSLLSIVIIFFLVNTGMAQMKPRSAQRNNLFSTELSEGFIGPVYERYFHLNQSFRATGRGGIGFSEGISYMIGSSIMFGKKANVELGLNYLMNVYDRVDNTNGFLLYEKINNYNTFLGFRYQNWKNGLSFRIFIIPPFGYYKNPWGWPNAGLSVGCAF